PLVLFGSSYWTKVIDFQALEDFGTIDAADLELFFRTDSVDEAYDYITDQLSRYALAEPGPRL
ncbi:MAG: lysine decarboxylase, partial [Kiloniellales bacterium]